MTSPLLGPNGQPLAPSPALADEMAARAKALFEAFQTFAQAEKITPGEMLDLLANAYNMWLNSCHGSAASANQAAGTFLEILAGVSQQTVLAKQSAEKIRRNLNESNAQGKPS